MDISYYKKYEPIFGEWRIVREIGEGSFGKVFEIEREDFGVTYKAALKAITIPQNQSELKNAMLEFEDDADSVTSYFEGFVEDTVTEFALMARLKGNSNIVGYEDHAVYKHSDGIGWDILIRMELLTPILDYVRANSLTRETIIGLGVDICKALEHCGKVNIIHRDIKPENVFVSEFGDFKLGDFGVARVAEKTMGGMSKKGTYNYMAPEVYKGEEYGASVDTYSLGLMLHRFLNNNRSPFLPQPPTPIKLADREAALARRLKGEAIPAPVNADDELAKIILKACAYDPKDRYSSPAEMRKALEAAAKNAEATIAAQPAEEDEDKTVGIFSSVKTPAVIENPSEAETVPEGPAVKKETNIPGEETAVDVPLENGNETVGIFRNEIIPAVVENPLEAVTVLEKPIENKEAPAAEAVTVAETVDGDNTVSVFENMSEISDITGNALDDNRFTIKNSAKTENKRKKRVTIAGTVMIACILVCILIIALWNGKRTEWSEWVEELPSRVNYEEYIIEKKVMYSSRNRETKMSTASKNLIGWTLYDTLLPDECSEWSEWSTTKPDSNNSRRVETQTQYRYRDLLTTTSSSPKMSGWEYVDSKTTGEWTEFKECDFRGKEDYFSDTHRYSECVKYIVDGVLYGEEIPGIYEKKEVWYDGHSKESIPSDKSGVVHIVAYYSDYVTTTTYTFQRWGEWSSWSTSEVYASTTRKTETRTLYRYCDYVNETTYCFERWTDWSDWREEEIKPEEDTEIRTTTFYRYKLL